MDLIPKNKQTKCSGKVALENCGKNATLLLEDEWEEIRRVRGENKGEFYIIPEHGSITIRFPTECIGQPVRVFAGK